MATLALDFPANLTTKYQPRSLSEFCGLEKQCKMLSKLAQNPPKDGAALLFEGGPGTGKTSAAFCFANSIIGRAEIHHIGSQESTLDNWRSVTAMCQYVPFNAKFHVVIADEIDKSSPAVMLYLLSRLDGSCPMPATFLIGTCNDTSTLEPRFLSRFIRLPKFNCYGASEDVKALLRRVWSDCAGDAPEPDYSRVPTSNVREALNWLFVELLSI